MTPTRIVDAPLSTTVRPRLPLDLALSLGSLRRGPYDPTVSIAPDEAWRATRTRSGPATVRVSRTSGGFTVDAWGAGAAEALDAGPALLGARDDLTGWRPDLHPLVREASRRHPGLRMIRAGAVLEALVPIVCEQKVTSKEAHTAWRRLATGLGERAPGPARLLLPPSPNVLTRTPYHAFHRFGLERRRADTIRRLADRAHRVEEVLEMPLDARRPRIEAFPGVGPWTSAGVASVSWGDPDAVRVGDFHVARDVVYALTGRTGGDDDGMLELLEPFRPHRGRAARLILLAGPRHPKRAPGRPLRDFRGF